MERGGLQSPRSFHFFPPVAPVSPITAWPPLSRAGHFDAYPQDTPACGPINQLLMRHPFPYVLALLSLVLPACAPEKKPPPPREFHLTSPYTDVRTYAVAPVVNLSGSRDLDPLAISDVLFSELQQVQNLNVLPVNKTLAAMELLKIRTINTPQKAQAIAEAVGADALVVPAITSYDPYNPPSIGMSLQLYTLDTLAGPPPVVSHQINGAAIPGDAPKARQPVVEIAAIFNATNQTVLQELQSFARGRTDYQSALQEERFLADIDAYTRFVCHAMVRRLIEVERVRSPDR
jgi:hypothetical protein